MGYNPQEKKGCVRCIDGELDYYTSITTGQFGHSQVIYKCDKCETEYAERLTERGKR